jgi:hypothetical protein
MNAIVTKILDLPHATLLTYAAIALSLIGYLNGTLTLEQAFITSGVGTAGAGALGIARNGSGRGVKK